MRINFKKALLYTSMILLLIVVSVIIVLDLCMGECVTKKSDKTRAELYSLYTAVNMFKLDTGRYPTQKEGLEVLVHQPENAQGWAMDGYFENNEVPKDDWGNEYIYVSRPRSKPPFEIISLGADGFLGGDGEDADLSTRQIIESNL